MLYPWQNDIYNQLIISNQQKVARGVMLYGSKYIGKHALAEHYINYLLCDTPIDNHACGKCHSCLLITHNTHPDLLKLEAINTEEVKNPTIKIEQVRELLTKSSSTSHASLRQVVYIPYTEQLNTNSANALLKSLEEPSGNCFFILICEDLSKVLPTILSRCMKFHIQAPSIEQANQYLQNNSNHGKTEFWLAYYNNAPLFEEQLSEEQLTLITNGLCKPSVDNIFAISKEFDGKNVSFEFFLTFMQKWLCDLYLIKNQLPENYFANYINLIKTLPQLNDEKFFSLQDKLCALTPWSKHTLNQKLQIENVLLSYQQIFSK